MTRTAERKHVSVLFADFAGFTSLAEKLDPEEVTEMLLPAMASLRAVVEMFGGTIIQVAGDGFFAAFGAPNAYEDHAERAIRAAFAVRDRSRASNLPEIHAGVNSGEVFVTPSDDRAGFTLYGDAVNTASRLCDLAPAGVILCGDTARTLSSHAIAFGRPKRKRIKGKADEVVIVEAIAPKEHAPAGRPPSSRTTSFTGRQAAIATLTKKLETVKRNQSALVILVRGEAGIGKSRLAREFLSGLDGASVLSGRCSPYGGSTPLSAIARAIAARAGAPLDDVDRQAKIRAFASSIGLSSASASRLISFCGPEHNVKEALTVADSISIVRETLVGLAGVLPPLVMVLDDIHWADPEMVEWLSMMDRDRLSIPLLVVVLSRPDVPRTLAKIDRLELPALPDTVMRAIAGEHLAAPASPGITRSLVDSAGGNPLFLEECVNMLRESGRLRLESGRWHMSDSISGERVPTTLRGLLAARLDALDATTKRVAQIAAVCGSSTWDHLLEHIEQGASTGLARLEDRGLLRRRKISSISGCVEYEFKHVLIRDVAEASVPKRSRAEIHVRIATWLQKRSREDAFRVDSIAHHFESAYRLGVTDAAADAVDYLTRCGNDAFLHQARLAESIFTKAISIASETRVDPGLHAAALAGRAEALLERGRHAQANIDTRKARKLAADYPDLVARAKLIEGSSQSLQGNISRSRTLLNEARDMFRSLGDSKGEAATLLRLAPTYAILDMPKAISLLRESRDVARSARDHWGQARALQELANALSATTSREFRKIFAEASLLIGDDANLRLRAALLRTGAYRAALSADFIRASELARRARSLAQEAGALSIEADTLLVESMACAAFGSPESAIEVASFVAPIANKLRSKGLKALGICAAAVPMQRAGQRQRAHTQIRSSRAILRIAQPSQLAEVDLAEASLELERGRYARVREPALNARKRVLAMGYNAYAVFGTLSCGRAQLGSGNFSEATQELRSCAKEAVGAPKLAAFAHACADQAELLDGRSPRVRSVDASGFTELQAVLLENEALRKNGSFGPAIKAWRTLGLTSWLGRALAFEGRDQEADEIFRELGAPAKIRDRFSSSIEQVRKGGATWKSL